MPVTTSVDIEALESLMEGVNVETAISLQPVSTDTEATALCIETCRLHNWNLSLQTHKLTGVR